MAELASLGPATPGRPFCHLPGGPVCSCAPAGYAHSGYLVAGTGGWLGERLVLNSPYAVVSVGGQRWRVATNLTSKQIGKHALMSPEWIERVSWEDGKVYVNLSREAIKNAPAYAPGSIISREYEAELCRHYGREGYWARAGCALNQGE